MNKILLVEDDKVNRITISKILEKQGYCVVKCSTGAPVIQMLHDNPDITLLVTDIILPDIDGRDITKVIREDGLLKDIPIIMISGKVSIKEVDSLLQIGVSRFLPKPVKAEELLGYVKKYMK